WSGEQKALHVVDVASGTEVSGLAVRADELCFSPDGETLAGSIDPGGHVMIWKLPELKEVATIKRPKNNQLATLAFSSDGKLLALADFDAIVIWDMAARKETRRLLKAAMGRATFSPDGESLTCALELDIHIWNLKTGNRV